MAMVWKFNEYIYFMENLYGKTKGIIIYTILQIHITGNNENPYPWIDYIQKRAFFVYFFYWTGGTRLFRNDIEIIWFSNIFIICELYVYINL